MALVREWAEQKKPALVWDLGGNTGVFSREAGASGAQVISFDIDPAAVEQNYRHVKSNKDQNILPLVLDLTNPSPALGWSNSERNSFGERGPADMVLALACDPSPFDLEQCAFAKAGRVLCSNVQVAGDRVRAQI